MHCAHCGTGECVLASSDPIVLKCNHCGTHWTDCDNLAERLERLERFVLLLARHVSHLLPHFNRESLEHYGHAIRQDLAEIDRNQPPKE